MASLVKNASKHSPHLLCIYRADSIMDSHTTGPVFKNKWKQYAFY